MEKKIFLIINLSYFGDVLLTNSLCQNIKKNYPDSKIIYIVDKLFIEAALYQDCVDEVFVFDKKKKNKGLFGMLKFVFSFPYRNKIFAAFSIYANERAVILSYLLNSKHRISGSRTINKYLLTEVHNDNKNLCHMQDLNADLLSALTDKKIEIFPIIYNTDKINDEFANSIISKYRGKEVFGLCTLSKNQKKDMPIETAVKIVNKLNEDGKTVFYFGAGDLSIKYSEMLKNYGCNFVDFTNKTSISQLGVLIKFCKGMISVDTGTMHLACAVKTPVAVVFYLKDYIKKWAPRKELYKSEIIIDDYSCENIVNKLYSICY